MGPFSFSGLTRAVANALFAPLARLVQGSGGTTGLTLTGGGDLSADRTLTLGGTLVVANGGTGAGTFTAYSVLCAGPTATGAFQNVVGLGTAGQVLTSNGAGALPTWQTSGGGTLPDPVTVPHGGTGLTTLTAHGILLGEGAANVAATAAMSDGQLLVGQTGADPLPKTLSGSGATVALSAAGVLTITNVANASLANSSVTVTAGTGLSGGGAVSLGGSVTLSLPNVGTAGTYGQVTTDAQGRVSGGATCDVAHGGTGATSFTAYTVLCAGTTGSGPLQSVASLGTYGQVLTSQGSGALPAFSDVLNWINVKGYGAKGDGRVANDGAITSGQATLSSTTLAFTSADAGKSVVVVGAGAAGANLLTTILSASGGVATLNATAGTTVTNAAVGVATNDNSAIQTAMNALSAGEGLFFPDGIYGLADPPQDTSISNAQLLLPRVSNAVPTPTVRLVGSRVQSGSLSTVATNLPAPTAGAILFSMRSDGGTAAVIGGARNVASAPDFSLSQVHVEKLTVRTLGKGAMTGLNLQYQAGAKLQDVVVDVQSVYSTDKVPDPSANTSNYGIILPANNNSAFTELRNVTVSGYYVAVQAGEHMDADGVSTYANIFSCKFPGATHSLHIGRWLDQWSAYGFAFYNSVTYLRVQEFDVEAATSGTFQRVNDVYDPNGYAHGDCRYLIIQAGSGSVIAPVYNPSGGPANLAMTQVGSPLALKGGGTGLDTSAVTDGQVLIGRTSDHTFGLATLTAGANITITNAGHSITIAATGGGGGSGAALNVATNGGFWFFQRQAPATLTSYANGSYGPDRFYLLGDSGATDIQTQRADESANGLTEHYSCQVKNNNAATKHVGIAQIVPAADSIPLRGQTVTFSVNLKASTSRNLRMAILEWTGALDAVAFGGGVNRDPVGNWASATYTAGNFFNNTSLTVDSVSGSLAATTSYQTFTLSHAVTTSCSNLVLMVWDEGGAPTAGTINLMEWGVYPGSSAPTWAPLPQAHELARCQRFYTKTYAVDVAPGVAATFGGALVQVASFTGTSSLYGQFRFPVTMRTTPTMTSYNPSSGATGSWRDGNDTTSVTATVTGIGSTCASVFNSASASAQGNYFIHLTADAEL